AVELFELAHGIDHRPVKVSRERKSLTIEETYPKDLQTLEEGLAQIPSLYADWEARMKKANLVDRIRGLVVKIKTADFKGSTHECSFEGWPSVEEFETLFRRAWERRQEPLRLIGLGARLAHREKDPNSPQLDLFEAS